MIQTTPHPESPALVTLALALDRQLPAGAPPDLAEIEAWRQGQLAASRAAEVRTYLARDPALFSQLLELEAANNLERRLIALEGSIGDIGDKRPAPLFRRIWSRHSLPRPTAPWLWGGGLALAALLTGVTVLVPRLVPPSPTDPAVAKIPASPGLYPGVERELLRLDPERDHQERVPVRVPLAPQPGGSETSPNSKGVDGNQGSGARPNSKRLDGDRFAVLAFQQGAGQDQADPSEPDSAAFRFTLSRCPSGDVDCRARRDAYTRLGRWAAEINKSCQGMTTAEPDWMATADELDRLALTLGGATDEPLAATATAVKGAREPATLCATAWRLLDLAKARRYP